MPEPTKNIYQEYEYMLPGCKTSLRNHFWYLSLLITCVLWSAIILVAIYGSQFMPYLIVALILYLLDTIFNNPLKALLAQPIQQFEQVILYQSLLLKAAPQLIVNFITYHIQQIGRRPQRVITHRMLYEFPYDECMDSTKNIDNVYELMPMFIVDSKLVWNFGDEYTRKQYDEFI